MRCNWCLTTCGLVEPRTGPVSLYVRLHVKSRRYRNGIKEPVPTFSACFGEAFLPLHPFVYADMLEKLCKEHHVKVWLFNTGWYRGPYGVGQRMDLKQTRAIIQGIHDSSLDMSKHQVMRRLQLKVPIKWGVCPPSYSDLLSRGRTRKLTRKLQWIWHWNSTKTSKGTLVACQAPWSNMGAQIWIYDY